MNTDNNSNDNSNDDESLDSYMDFMISYGDWERYLKYLDDQKEFYLGELKQYCDYLKEKFPDLATTIDGLVAASTEASENAAIPEVLKTRLEPNSHEYLTALAETAMIRGLAKKNAVGSYDDYNKNLQEEYKKSLAAMIANPQYTQALADKFGAAAAGNMFLEQEITKMKGYLEKMKQMLEVGQGFAPEYQGLANEVKEKFFPFRDLTDLAMMHHLESRVRAATDLLTDHKTQS